MSLSQEYSPQDPKPLSGYAMLLLIFNGLVAAFALVFARSRQRLPRSIPPSDLALMSVSTFKLSRIITKDKVTAVVRAPFTRYEESGGPAEVEETTRGENQVTEAIGELFTCPYCIGQWIASGFVALYIWQPATARTVASLFAVSTGADYLQQAWLAVDRAV